MVEEQTAKLPVCRTMGSSISSLLGAAAAAASRHGLSAGCQVSAWLLHSRRLIEACTCIAATNTSHQNPPKVKKSVQHTDVAPGHTCACRRPRALAMWPAPKCGLAGPCSNPSRRSSLATGGEPRQSRVSVVAAPPPPTPWTGAARHQWPGYCDGLDCCRGLQAHTLVLATLPALWAACKRRYGRVPHLCAALISSLSAGFDDSCLLLLCMCRPQ